MNNALQNAGVKSAAAAYLMTKLGQLNPDAAAKLAAGNLEIVDAEVMHTFAPVTGNTGTITAMDNSGSPVVKEIGVTDFDNGMLPKDQYFAVDRIILDTAGTAASHTPKTKAYSPAKFDIAGAARYVPEILNGRLRVFANNKPIIDLPVDSFVINGREFTGIENVRQLGIPKLIPGGTEIKIELAVSGAVTGTAAHYHHLKVRFIGAVTKSAPGA